jgi:hypothetical protein
LRRINLFGIVDEGGTGNPIQTNRLSDQTTGSKGSSEVVSMLYLFLVHKLNVIVFLRHGKSISMLIIVRDKIKRVP